MELNPLAVEQNEILKAEAPAVLDLLSTLGKKYYFPKGILSQTAEAKVKAKRFNATVGIALEGGAPMFLPSMLALTPGIDPRELVTYAPPAGKPELRDLWREKQLEENPLQRDKRIGRPIATSALTHGLSLLAELFVDPGDVILLPDQLWGNYRLTYAVRHGARIETFPFFNGGGMNVAGFERDLKLLAREREKLIVILNFPNNPTGYTPTPAESESMARSIEGAASAGTKILAICDDAYFNLVYDDACLKESIFGYLAGLHENVLAARLDGATKEHFVWGYRVGFISYAAGGGGDLDAVHRALENKTAGAIRAGISNSPHISQTLVLKGLQSPSFASEQAEKREILRRRAVRAKEVLENPKYAEVWNPYPFNSGYFMCLELKGVEAEALRVHLLDKYELGTIATGKYDLRVAFSCLEEDQIADVYEDIYRGALDLKNA